MITDVAKLLCIASLSALAMSAYAQTDTKSSDKATTTAQAQGTMAPSTGYQGSTGNQDYKAAIAACDSKPATDRDQCRKDADAKYKAVAPNGSIATHLPLSPRTIARRAAAPNKAPRSCLQGEPRGSPFLAVSLSAAVRHATEVSDAAGSA